MANLMAVKRRDATTEDIRTLRNFKGKVLTAPEMSNGLNISEQSTRLCALLDDGTFLRHKTEAFAQEVLSVLMQIKQNSLPITQELLVEPSVIRQVYEEFARRNPRANTGPVTTESAGIVTEISPQQRLLLEIVRDANAIRATDIRIHARAKEAILWFRIGGALRKIREFDAREMRQSFSAIYSLLGDVRATFDPTTITQAVLPREKLTSIVPDRVQGLRMQFVPAGKDSVFLSARMITVDSATISLDDLGWSPTHTKQFKWMRRKPWGVFFITGPTGAGKSTTLKVSMEALAIETAGEASILTCEDPAEYALEHDIVQFSLKGESTSEARAQAFNNLLASILRSDPDIVMVGEVREEQSMSLAMKAAETGHGTWTTLHTNNTISIFPRLRGMNGKDFNIFNHELVVAGVAQRLVREVCPHCSGSFANVKDTLSTDQHARYQKIFQDYPGLLRRVRFRNEKGCSEAAKREHGQSCTRGYKGRTLIAEVLLPDEEFMTLARENKVAAALAYWEQNLEGVSMAEHGWYKVAKGLCDPADVEVAIGDLSIVRPERYAIIVDRNEANGATLLDLENGTDQHPMRAAG